MADSLPTIYYRYFSDSRIGPHRRLGIGAARDVKLYGLQVVRLSHRLSHGVRIPASGDDRVTGHQRGFGESTPMPRPAPVISQVFLLLMTSP
jgi:hypothetical protein